MGNKHERKNWELLKESPLSDAELSFHDKTARLASTYTEEGFDVRCIILYAGTPNHVTQSG